MTREQILSYFQARYEQGAISQAERDMIFELGGVNLEAPPEELKA